MRPALRLISSNFSSGFGEGGAPNPKSSNGTHRKSTILVVEDEVLQRFPVAEFLRNAGYRVLEAGNADDARAIFRAGEPVEMVFSDVNMPGEMNGFELAHWIRTAFPDVRVLLTSGVDHMATNKGYGLEDGPVLPKPYLYETLLEHIKRLLR